MTQLSAQVQTNVPQVVPGAKSVTVERIKVHGDALQGNLEGDAVDRDVIVFLPPGYATNKTRRYPVVYALHGYSIGADQWTHEIHVPQTIEGAFALGANEMIVVLPDSKTVYNGSMYSSSATTGDFEKFISHDLVAYIDAHYRTLADRKSRGLAGHSMGGYGATRIGMKHPDVFGALYIMSPCCLSPMTGGGPGPADQAKERAIANEKKVAAAKSPVALAADSPGFASAVFATAAAWAPRSQEPAALFRFTHERRRTAARHHGQIRGKTHRLRLPTSTLAILSSTGPLRWTSATRMACAQTPPGCMNCSIATRCKTALKSTQGRIPALLPIGFRIT